MPDKINLPGLQKNKKLIPLKRVAHKLLYIFIFSSSFYFGQRIKNFNAFQVNNSVVLKFTVGAGPTCNGYTVLYSADSTFYNAIYDYPGICGNSTADDSQSWTHGNPAFNQNNYYKIQLNPGETSLAQKVFVVPQTKATLFAYPNPINNYTDLLSLRILGANNLRTVGFLYDQFGKPLRELDLRTVVDTSTLNINDLRDGLYVIWLTDGFMAYSTKFIIQR